MRKKAKVHKISFDKCRLCHTSEELEDIRDEGVCDLCYSVLQQFWEFSAILSSAQKKQYKELYGFDFDDIHDQSTRNQASDDFKVIDDVSAYKDTWAMHTEKIDSMPTGIDEVNEKKSMGREENNVTSGTCELDIEQELNFKLIKESEQLCSNSQYQRKCDKSGNNLSFLEFTSEDVDEHGAIIQDQVEKHNDLNYEKLRIACALCSIVYAYTDIVSHYRNMHPHEQPRYFCTYCKDRDQKKKRVFDKCKSIRHFIQHFPKLKQW